MELPKRRVREKKAEGEAGPGGMGVKTVSSVKRKHTLCFAPADTVPFASAPTCRHRAADVTEPRTPQCTVKGAARGHSPAAPSGRDVSCGTPGSRAPTVTRALKDTEPTCIFRPESRGRNDLGAQQPALGSFPENSVLQPELGLGPRASGLAHADQFSKPSQCPVESHTADWGLASWQGRRSLFPSVRCGRPRPSPTSEPHQTPFHLRPRLPPLQRPTRARLPGSACCRHSPTKHSPSS